MNKTILLVIACGLMASQAKSQPPIVVEGQPAIPVPYGDLDLSRPAGQAALMGRVHRAAERLCAATEERGVGPTVEARRCLSFALAGAHAQINRAVALYSTREFAARSSVTVAVQ